MGTLYIVSTPIGNLEDITIHAVKILFSVDFIACEDTRKTSFLLHELQKKFTSLLYGNDIKLTDKPILISYYDEVEFKKATEIADLLTEGRNVALVTDSGTPLISDPGFKLVSLCLNRNIKIMSIPGPSSVLSALTISGLPTNQFVFLGYLPPKKSKRIKILTDLNLFIYKSVHLKPTVIIFESPHRLKECLNAIKEIFGDIEIVIVRELTKIHEEIWRGKITDCPVTLKGEMVLLFNIPLR